MPIFKSIRFYVLCLVVIFSLLIFVDVARAHVGEQPPFFKVNGVYSDLYPVPTTSLADFPLPQDAGPENYLIRQVINFEIDTVQLAVPAEVVAKTTFSWDFGDGERGQGLKNSHTYTAPGSYLLTIYAKYDQISGDQLFQSILLNVLPDKSYQLPQAKIMVNGQTSEDPLVDVLRFPYGTELNFDASDSSAPSSRIVEYFWDFGDSQSSNEVKTTHTYSKDLPQQQVFPVLRIKDENGFIADAFLEIDRQSPAPFGLNAGSNTGGLASSKKALFVLGGIGIVLIGGTIVLAYRKK